MPCGSLFLFQLNSAFSSRPPETSKKNGEECNNNCTYRTVWLAFVSMAFLFSVQGTNERKQYNMAGECPSHETPRRYAAKQLARKDLFGVGRRVGIGINVHIWRHTSNTAHNFVCPMLIELTPRPTVIRKWDQRITQPSWSFLYLITENRKGRRD